MGMNFKQEPFGGHQLGEDLRPPTTFQGVPTIKIHSRIWLEGEQKNKF